MQRFSFTEVEIQLISSDQKHRNLISPWNQGTMPLHSIDALVQLPSSDERFRPVHICLEECTVASLSVKFETVLKNK